MELAIEHVVGCPGARGRKCRCGADAALRFAASRYRSGSREWAERFAEFLSELMNLDISPDSILADRISSYRCDVPGIPHAMKIDSMRGRVFLAFPDGQMYGTDEYVVRLPEWERTLGLSERSVAMLNLVAKMSKTIEQFCDEKPRPEVQ